MFAVVSSRVTWSTLPPRSRRVIASIVIIVGLSALFGGDLRERVGLMRDPLVFTDDARQWLAPYAIYEAGTPEGDYASTYTKVITPSGYRGVFEGLSRYFEPGAAGKVLSMLLLATLLFGLGVAGHRFAGAPGVFFAMALALSCPMFVERMSGGLPRGFGYPVLALAAAALVTGRMVWLCAIVVIASAFYPPAALVSGVSLSTVLLIMPARCRGDAAEWTLRRRVTAVAVTCGICVLLMLPATLNARPYGAALGPSDLVAYPEIGAAGRYDPPSRPPYPNVFRAIVEQSASTLMGAGHPVLGVAIGRRLLETRVPWLARVAQGGLLVAALLGFVVFSRGSPAAWRLAVLAPASAALYIAAVALAPRLFIPTRYITYPIPILTLLVLIAGGAALGRASFNWMARPVSPRAAQIGAAVLASVSLLLFGGRGAPMNGLIDERPLAPVFDFVRSLPQSSLLAGWPRRVLDDIPYATHRRVLLNYETHQVFHKEFVEEMRRRANAVFDAHFATTPEPITRLRDEFHVTHLIVNRRYFIETPKYFEPFNDGLARRYEAGRRDGFLLASPRKTSAVFDYGDYAVFDLSRFQ